MMYLNDVYINREDFIKKIKSAMDDILFKAADRELLGEVLYNELYSYVITQLNNNIRMIKDELTNGNTNWKITNHQSEIDTLKNKINSLENELHSLKNNLLNAVKPT